MNELDEKLTRAKWGRERSDRALPRFSPVRLSLRPSFPPSVCLSVCLSLRPSVFPSIILILQFMILFAMTINNVAVVSLTEFIYLPKFFLSYSVSDFDFPITF